jgi:hypothetical protein
MSALIVVELFVGLAFDLAVGSFSVSRELRLRIEYPPPPSPDYDDEEDEDVTARAALSSKQR